MVVQPTLHKRLGDSYYEQSLAAGYDNDLTQYRALLDNGAQFTQEYAQKRGMKLSIPPP